MPIRFQTGVHQQSFPGMIIDVLALQLNSFCLLVNVFFNGKEAAVSTVISSTGLFCLRCRFVTDHEGKYLHLKVALLSVSGDTSFHFVNNFTIKTVNLSLSYIRYGLTVVNIKNSGEVVQAAARSKGTSRMHPPINEKNSQTLVP